VRGAGGPIRQQPRHTFFVALLIGVDGRNRRECSSPSLRSGPAGYQLAIVTHVSRSSFLSALINFDNPSMTGWIRSIVVKSPRSRLPIISIAPSKLHAALMLIALVLVGLMVANLRRGRRPQDDCRSQ